MTHRFKELREELIRLREAVDAATKIDNMIATESSFTEKLRGNFKTILAALEIAERGEWAKCSERMPEVGASVLIYDSGNFPKIHCARWVSEDWSDTFVFKIAQGGEYKPGYSAGSNIAHWMPLPPPPEEK